MAHCVTWRNSPARPRLRSARPGHGALRVQAGRAVAALGVLAAAGGVVALPAPAAAACTATPPASRPGLTGEPWAQRLWDLPRLDALNANGIGVVVAVID